MTSFTIYFSQAQKYKINKIFLIKKKTYEFSKIVLPLFSLCYAYHDLGNMAFDVSIVNNR